MGKPQNTYSNFVAELAEAHNENEVRHKICDLLGISSKIKMVGSTDGVVNDVLFEFKYDKKFKDGSNWHKSAFGTLAQSLYYCRKILNFECENVEKIPHTIVICDKNGGFVVPTKGLEWILHFDPNDDLDSHVYLEWVKYRKDYELLIAGGFTWSTPPSSQNKDLIELLMRNEVLKEINYLDFSDSDQIETFRVLAKESKGEFPTIQVTQQNFIGIFDKWFSTFSAKGDSRRDWVDRFVIDLRSQYALDKNKGVLKNSADSWKVSTDIYSTFWKIFKRPPSERVDEFIATNKDLLYEVSDQNNNGDFYTPIRLANLAQELMAKHLDSKIKRTWWDPAAGGGNLFFRFNQSTNVILTTKFDSDAKGLKNNPSVKSDLVMPLDFVNHLVEKDLTLRDEWSQIKKVISKNSELVFFMNPPFDDQAESGGTNTSLPEGFLDDDKVSARSLRSLHTRFLYRIMSLAKTLDRPIWVACFSKTAWVVGPDSETFCKQWQSNFEFLDGLIISSKVFNGTKGEWPCLFSFWKFDPKNKGKVKSREITVPVYEKDYSFAGYKTLKPFDSAMVRLTDLPKDKKFKVLFGPKDSFETVAPLKNEYEVSEIVYDDTLPKNALGYLRVVANDVYNSTQGVQIYSSMCGPSNSNGVPIIKENFLDALSVYGIRKSVRRNWINDKDEFYLSAGESEDVLKLKQSAALYALIDGGYASSMSDLKYQKKTYSFRNHFFLLSNLELKNLGADDLPEADSHAVQWIKDHKANFSEVGNAALQSAKDLIKATFNEGVRAKGDVKRQLDRGDAGLRQLLNGLFDYEGAEISESLKKKYEIYLERKEQLRQEIEKSVYSLNVLMPFTAAEGQEVPFAELTKGLKRAQKISAKKSKSNKKKSV